MVFELRQYRIQPGQRDNWVKFADEEMIPFQTSKGMNIVGSFVGDEDENLFVWIRRFENEQQREQLYKAVYESDEWKNQLAPKIGPMLDREKMVITRLVPTPDSALR
ncbi:MAG: NIPSNAP family protein [Candidatus Dormibacteraeota bacterium]|nr:NIPSNAP family protein [Candidatus Dormibacteraeota bacterium]